MPTDFLSGEVIVAAVAATAAVIALYFNHRSARAAQRAAKAAEDQTELQKKIYIDTAQPQVWADIRPDESVGVLLNLVVGNSGSTTARNVRVTSDRKLPRIRQFEERVSIAEKRLATGLPSLPPGRTYTWPLGQGFNLINSDLPENSYALTVEADGPFGPVAPATYLIDLSALDGVLDRPAGSIHELTRAVRDLKGS